MQVIIIMPSFSGATTTLMCCFSILYSLHSECTVAFGSNSAFFIIDNAFFKNLLYLLFRNLSARHPAFRMFGQNREGVISEKPCMAFLRTQCIKSSYD